MGGLAGRVEAVEPEDGAVAALERAQASLGVQTTGAGCPQRSQVSDEDGPSQLARTALMKMSGTSSARSAA